MGRVVEWRSGGSLMIKDRPNRDSGFPGFTLVELLVVVAIMAVLAGILLPVLATTRESSRRSVCANSLKQWGLSLKMFAAESKGGLYPRMQCGNDARNVAERDANPVAFPCMTTGKGPGMDAAFYSAQAMYPEYIADLRLMACPSTRTTLLDAIACPGGDWCGSDGAFDGGRMCKRKKGVIYNNYVYYGYLAENDAAWLTMVQYAYSYPNWGIADANDQVAPGKTDMRSWVYENHVLDDTITSILTSKRMTRYVPLLGAEVPLPPTANGGGKTVHRLREGIEKILITDVNNPSANARAQSAVPLMYEPLGVFDATSGLPDYGMTGFNHLPSGCNVLYMDGHVEFVKYMSRYPVDRLVAVVGPLS